ncbi:MAG TPA: M48 family metalloprotease [Thermoplasmata archaeon]|nr:M48 family metalloprotease [Thermoplasmata archaeon]
MSAPALDVLYVPVALWGASGLALVAAMRRSTPRVVLRLASGFTALWALLATTVFLWVLSHGGWSAIAALVRSPLLLLSPAALPTWVAGVVGVLVVFSAAFWLNQLVGRAFLVLWRPQPLRWPQGLPRPEGDVRLLAIPDARLQAFSFALLGLREGSRWRAHRQEVILLSRGLLDFLSPAEIEAVVAHELGHLKDLDARYLTFLRTLARMMRWDPVLGYVAWRLSRHEEYSADDEAVRITRAPLPLARALYKVLVAPGPPVPGSLALVGPSRTRRGRRDALRRIQRLIEMYESVSGVPGV